MHDGTKLFTIDTSDVMVAVNADAWQASTSYIEGDFVENDSGKIYIATSDGDSAGSGGPTGTGTGISDNTVTWDYLETVTGGSNIPSSIIPGLVALDQYVFLADSDGNIYNSNVQDVYTWTSGDFIVAETLPDKLVQIARHVNYLVGFGEKGTEFFYNAANPNGSPLSKMEGTFLYLGAQAGATAVNIDEQLIWVSKNQVGTLNVTILNGFEHKHVATPAIVNTLNIEQPAATMWEGDYYNLFGKRLYVLSIADEARS